ncbi:WD40 repeat domain-containing protein [Streptosporangium sp. KLBMP 9127]|nr:WD40 repeat domain-containing protein [Streptosporangium sp. KLBMP 9127]
MSVRQLGAPEDLETLRPLPARSPAPERITAIAATADLSRVAIATTAPWFREFSEVLLLAEGTVVRLSAPGRRRVLDLVFDPDGSALTAMASGNSILRWSFDAPGEPWTRAMTWGGGADGPDLAQAAGSADGRFFATSNAFSQNVVVRDAATRHVVHDIEDIFKGLAYEDRIQGEGTVALNADGSRLAFSRARRWSSKEGVVVQEIGSRACTEYRTGIPWVNGLAFSPDGAALAVVGARPDETVATVVDLNDPADEPEPVVLPTDDRVDRINLRPVWCGTEPFVPIVDPRRVTVWNLATASARLSVDAPGLRIAAALTPDGRTLVIASPDDGVRAHSLPSLTS